MRVNLNYSLEVERVLPTLNELYQEGREVFERHYNTLSKVSQPIGHTNLAAGLHEIEETRRVLEEYATRLTEIGAMLQGYKEMLEGAPRSPVDNSAQNPPESFTPPFPLEPDTTENEEPDA